MTPAAAEYDTLADVLGGIPLHRVLRRPYPGTATEADQLRYIERDKRRTADALTGDPVPPGLVLPVADIFGYRDPLPPDADPTPPADQ